MNHDARIKPCTVERSSMMYLLRRWAYQGQEWKLQIAPFILISPLIFIIPPDVFAQYSWTRNYTDLIASIVPMIDRTSHLHPHPDKFRVYCAYAWTCFPLFSILFCLALRSIPEKMDMWWATHEDSWIKLALANVMIVCAIYLFGYVPGDGGLTSALITTSDIRHRLYRSDISLAWSIPLLILASAGFVAFVEHQLSRIFLLTFKKAKQRQHDR